MKVRSFLLAGFSAAALLSTVAISPAAAAVQAESPIQGACLERAIAQTVDYRASNNLSDVDSTYIACTDGVATVWGVTDAGDEITPSAEADRNDGDAQRSGSGGATCEILNHLEARCQSSTSYSKIDGETGVPEWTRHIDADYEIYPLWSFERVYSSYRQREFIPIDVIGSMILQQQQGALPPTYDSAENFDSLGQASSGISLGHEIYRNNLGTAKFSIVFDLQYIHDYEDNVDIPIIGEPTSPRFQCYDDLSPTPQCEFPNGEEAGVL